MSQVYLFEVELKIINKTTGESRLTQRQEYAYGVQAAVEQAIYNTLAHEPEGTTDLKLWRVSPPHSVCVAATVKEMEQALDELTKTVGSMAGGAAKSMSDLVTKIKDLMAKAEAKRAEKR